MTKAELTDVICAEQNLIRKVGITGRALNITITKVHQKELAEDLKE